MAGETVWLNQSQMADLFLTTKQNIGQHIRNVFAEGELAPESVVKDFFTTAADGKQRGGPAQLDRIPASLSGLSAG